MLHEERDAYGFQIYSSIWPTTRAITHNGDDDDNDDDNDDNNDGKSNVNIIYFFFFPFFIFCNVSLPVRRPRHETYVYAYTYI